MTSSGLGRPPVQNAFQTASTCDRTSPVTIVRTCKVNGHGCPQQKAARAQATGMRQRHRRSPPAFGMIAKRLGSRRLCAKRTHAFAWVKYPQGESNTQNALKKSSERVPKRKKVGYNPTHVRQEERLSPLVGQGQACVLEATRLLASACDEEGQELRVGSGGGEG